MFTCKQVSSALHREDYKDLPPLRRFFLKLHVKLCIFCGKFNRQVMESQDMCRCYKEHEDELIQNSPKMEDSKKAELERLLAEQSAK
ncbi:hypothetical protein [Coraliomargarita akajimensis]|uniref:Uncharacterized protein n=1 Tax=Coraliomargarita akajimensis (strain DSM 45221 / IAM 15411 / JCM 23193 / KCTC 12865 / 04OKA010-24) TaxID=583355 RepID=D5EJE6_CORAD|nr:hypothetical protein [Coraliomargarita akajimensis]ADE54545.1 hypothetical protein Caka_1526 [Coraliomargarita akajimensis DSM 45221]